MYNIGQYIPGNSPVHRLDPRVKIILLVILSIFIFRADLTVSALTTAFYIIVIAVSRLGFLRVIKSLKPAAVFFAFLFLIHLFFTEGTPVFSFLPQYVSITFEGLHRGILYTWRFILLVLSASVLTMTTRPSGLVSGIERLLRPLNFTGISSHDTAMMISLALRFVPTLLEETQKIKEAQAARGANISSGSIFYKIKSAAALAMPLLVNSCRRVDELADAMEGRGYQRGPRTYMYELQLTRLDYAALLIGFILVFAACAYKYF
ncbi:MAG: energy-coupling factor transporter transmembrane protein EcfT [Clostridiales bacterium]|nr:energy-coupling factor transporter transmembrane protein EcfT [Clostridiales bacterium]MCF8023103.1 energy-coupling factor transporter transmembrane protein EcfT [Clostridiales bacterium]